MPVALAALTAAVAWPLLIESPAAHATGTQLLALALVGLSLTVTVGWLRVVTLFQPAAAAAGAAATAALVVEGLGPVAALVGATVAGAGVGVLALLPAGADPQRWLPATSLVLGAAAVLLVPRFVFRPFAPPSLLGVDLGSQAARYVAGLAMVAGACALVAWLRSAGTGRRVRAAGDAPAGTAGGWVAPPRAWVEGVALSGALAGCSGWLTALLHEGVPSALDFAPTTAVAYLAIPVVGGAGSVVGALVGAAAFLALARAALGLGLAAVSLPAVALVAAAAVGGRGGVVGWARRRLDDGAAGGLLRRLRRR